MGMNFMKVMMMNDRKEELLEIVGELADKYTGKESTSITYEKARQLMEAVIYCINEYEMNLKGNEELLFAEEPIPAKVSYGWGYEKVIEKGKETKKIYHEMMMDFKSYGNRCCSDTFVKGIPSFFLYYDPRFNPQDHILTLDYPVLAERNSLCGVDLINQYIRYASLEQSFLRKLPDEYIFHVLRAYDPDYGELFINLASIAVRNLLGCYMAGKTVEPHGYNKQELERLREYVKRNTREALEQAMRGMIDRIILSGYEGNRELKNYLKADMHDFGFELKNAVKNQYLEAVLAI